MQLVKIVPKCNRAKQRIVQHGEVMEFIRRDRFDGEPAILVRSLNDTWNCGKEKWGGWFTDKEATFEHVTNR